VRNTRNKLEAIETKRSIKLLTGLVLLLIFATMTARATGETWTNSQKWEFTDGSTAFIVVSEIKGDGIIKAGESKTYEIIFRLQDFDEGAGHVKVTGLKIETFGEKVTCKPDIDESFSYKGSGNNVIVKTTNTLNMKENLPSDDLTMVTTFRYYVWQGSAYSDVHTITTQANIELQGSGASITVCMGTLVIALIPVVSVIAYKLEK
jgi:hypothetical protein